MKAKYNGLVLLLLVVFFSGCTRHIQPPKFDIDTAIISDFLGNAPVAVIVPESANKEYQIKYADPEREGTAKIFVDLNDMYKAAKELIEQELANHKIIATASAEKQLKFTITDVQWEIWAGGFSIGSYLEFDIETGNGYTAHYKVQDGSGMDVSRAVGGTVARAVEKIFQDAKVIEYLTGV